MNDKLAFKLGVFFGRVEKFLDKINSDVVYDSFKDEISRDVDSLKCLAKDAMKLIYEEIENEK